MTSLPICNPESLKETIKRDNAVLIGEYNTIKRFIKISFKCNCGKYLKKIYIN